MREVFELGFEVSDVPLPIFNKFFCKGLHPQNANLLIYATPFSEGYYLIHSDNRKKIKHANWRMNYLLNLLDFK